jgi:hypothetical protein
MAVDHVERTGVLVLRVWVEHDGAGGLRARITESSDLSTRQQTTVVAGSVDEVLRIVREWVQAFASAGDESVTEP